MEKITRLEKILTPSPRMPVIFVGHGNPMNAIADNNFTRNWKKLGNQLPDAQATVVISAHWLTRGTHVTNAPKQEIIYDFYGFPEELYNVKFEANGDPKIAKLLKEYLIKYEAKLDNTWGLDHGTWSVLNHLNLNKKIPVLQISLDVGATLEQVVDTFKLLRPLRDKGVIFIGSGNIVHNLGMVDFGGKPQDWAMKYDDKIKDVIINKDIKSLVNPLKIDYTGKFAIPTDDHYRPMLASMGLLYEDEMINYFNEEIDLGSIGMRSFLTGSVN